VNQNHGLARRKIFKQLFEEVMTLEDATTEVGIAIDEGETEQDVP